MLDAVLSVWTFAWPLEETLKLWWVAMDRACHFGEVGRGAGRREILESSWAGDILPSNSRQIALLQIHMQHLFWWHLFLIKCHLFKSGHAALGRASPSLRSVYCCPLRASASCQPAPSSPACTLPSSRNSSKSHLRINSIINTFVGVKTKSDALSILHPP